MAKTTNRGWSKTPTTSPDYHVGSPLVNHDAALDDLDKVFAVEVDAGDGAIAIKEGTAVITKGSAAALTLAAPVAGLPSAATPGDDGKVLRIVSTTAFANVVTTPANKLNGNKLTATFAAAAGGGLHLIAYNGVWYVLGNNGVTLT
ncbi:MAG: hypothetical protein ACRD3E_09330 [Terriglobales bacterium]